VTQDDLLYFIGSVSGPWPSPPSSATTGRPAGPWASTPPPTTAGSGSWTITDRDPAAPRTPATRRANQTSMLVEQLIAAFALGLLASGPVRNRRQVGPPQLGRDHPVDQWCGGCQVATASRLGPTTRTWSPATPLYPSRAAPSPPERHLDVHHPGQLVQLDCSVSGGLPAPTAPCGRTPPSTWSRPTPSCHAG